MIYQLTVFFLILIFASTGSSDNFKKLFSEQKIAKKLLVQFSRACQDELIALEKFQKFEIFFVYNEFFPKNFIHLPDLF